MPKNKMVDLRNNLFETMERLMNPDKESPMDIETAEAIAELGKVIVESVKVQVAYAKITGAEINENLFSNEQKKLE